jgi:ribonuclease VapC
VIVDTSALIAILRKEPDWEALLNKLLAAPTSRMSAGTLIETRVVAEREGGSADLAILLAQAGVQVISVDQVQADAAHDGFLRFGKGRHPAALNLGDLFAYGLARVTGEPLLFKGNDFARTDLRAA